MARKATAQLRAPTRAAQVAARVNSQMKSNVIKFGSDDKFKITRIPTGSLVLDRLTGGGFARGRHITLYGDWTTGKSLVVYRTLALAQERGEVCALVDGENIFNGEWFEQCGGNMDDLLLYEPKTANELGNVLRLFVQKEEEVAGVDVVGIDSVASMLPKEELKYDMESEKDVRTASLARLMSLLLRQVTTANDDTTFIWTNQWRDKISSIPGLKSTPGGRALGFYSSTMLELMQGEKETATESIPLKGSMVDRKVVNGRWVNVRLAKEKTGARPEATASFMLDYETRKPDLAREILDLGMRDGLVEKNGEWFMINTIDGQLRSHGVKNFVKKVDADDELREFLVNCIQEQTYLLSVGEADG